MSPVQWHVVYLVSLLPGECHSIREGAVAATRTAGRACGGGRARRKGARAGAGPGLDTLDHRRLDHWKTLRDKQGRDKQGRDKQGRDKKREGPHPLDAGPP